MLISSSAWICEETCLGSQGNVNTETQLSSQRQAILKPDICPQPGNTDSRYRKFHVPTY